MPPSPSTATPCSPPPRFRSSVGARKKPTALRTLPRPTSTRGGGGPHPRVLGRPRVRPRGSGSVGSSEVAAAEEREGEKKKTVPPDRAAATLGRRRRLVKRRCPLPEFAYPDDTLQVHPNRRAARWSCNPTAAIFCNSMTGDDLGSNPGSNLLHEVFPEANHSVLEQLSKVDCIVYAMGSLFTSVCPSLDVDT